MNTRRKYIRITAGILLLVQLFEMIAPVTAYALTSGPVAPEVQSFEPAGASEMVNLFTGDFNYNIPLFELPGPNGGYPFNLAYHAGVGMDQEATWVGLGWNLNPGAIVRDNRGLPDDFNGDEVTIKEDMMVNWTVGVGVGFKIEPLSWDVLKGIGGSLDIYYNSYRGVGYRLGAEIDLQSTAKGSMNAGFGLNLSLDSQEGVGISPSIGLQTKRDNADSEYSSVTAGIGFNSKRGLTDISLSESNSVKRDKDNPKREMGTSTASTYGATVSFSNSAFTPQISSPMTGYGLSLNFSAGGEIKGIYLSGDIKGYYNEQKLAYKNVPRKVKAYGYLNLQNAEEDAMVDVNREKDGVIRPQTPNLAAPQMTYDVYTIQGQGVGGDFRPFRSDIGSLYDSRIESEYGNGSAGVGLGFGAGDIKVEVNANINYSHSFSGKWIGGGLNFKQKRDEDNTFEPAYFRVNGEPTTEALNARDYMGRDAVLRMNLSKPGDGNNLNDPTIKQNESFNMLNSSDVEVPVANYRSVNANSSRKPRNTTTISLKNSEISDANLFPDYKADYYNGVGVSQLGSGYDQAPLTLNRNSGLPEKAGAHIGAYSVLDASGSRYVYGLPVYNNTSVDRIYSVNDEAPVAGTKLVNTMVNNGFDQYLKEVKMPPYSTSHLLTAILGQDYIDVNNNGPDADDFGYWVKFTYVKVADRSANNCYKWRAPFAGANYIPDTRTKQSDNKASYLYGEREMYYLAKAETKSHVAVFDIEQRQDGRSANSETQQLGATILGNIKSYKLKSARLFAKTSYPNGNPIVTAHFGYVGDGSETPGQNELCKGIENGNANRGKLTLRNVWFTHENSLRGEASKYQFTYGKLTNGAESNPDYDRLEQDRWGTYKEYSTSNPDAHEFPYTEQSDGTVEAENREEAINAWNLTEIKTPTGSSIKINYESDDYAYVQNRVAGQMFTVKRFDQTLPNNQIYRNYNLGDNYNGGAESRKVYFDLETTITAASAAAATQIVKDTYLADLINPDGVKQLYFRILIDMKKNGDGAGRMKEFVSGYADIEDVGVVGSGGTYSEAWIKLKPTKVGKRIIQGHPFSVAAWTYLRTNLPDVYSTLGSINAPAGTADADKLGKAKSLMNAFGSLTDLFTDYYRRCFRKDFAKFVDGTATNAQNCVIRLNTPDKKKYGGGHRVKSIIMSDAWDVSTGGIEKRSEYGVVYDYTTIENNKLISSGVAQYEPTVGGDEIALRYARTYHESIPLKSATNSYFEYPINESFFPGPVVGYSKVTVRSLATDRQVYNAGLLPTDPAYVPATAATTGEAVHDFYTAKEFPVITEMTAFKTGNVVNAPGKEVSKVREKFVIPVIGLGNISVDNLTASQGYKIELNDMHGKQKQITYFGMNSNGTFNRDKPISYVKYNYQSIDNFVSDVHRVPHKKLTSLVQTLTEDGIVEQREMGVDCDFFTDARENNTYSATGGVDVNVDGMYFGIFYLALPIPWPAVSYNENIVRLNVANKIIHRTGIITSTEAYDGESKVLTNNMFFDAVSGRPLLTTVNNNFDDPVYNYSMPAHWAYEQMGPAYKNIGMEIYLDPANVTWASMGSGTNDFSIIDAGINTIVKNHISEGDVLLLTHSGGVARCRVTYKQGTVAYIHVEHGTAPTGSMTSGTSAKFKIVRPGRKNLLNVDASNIKSLQSPIAPRKTLTCSIGAPSTTLEQNMEQIEVAVGKFLQLLNAYLDTHSWGTFDITPSDPLWSTYITDVSPKIRSIHVSSDGWFTIDGGSGPPCFITLTTAGAVGGGGTPPCWPPAEFVLPFHLTSVTGNPSNLNYEGTVEVICSTGVHHTYGILTKAYCVDIAGEAPVTSCDEFNYMTIDKVISATAQKFSDRWHQTFNDVEQPVCSSTAPDLRVMSDKNPFSTGEAGIWRGEESFVYVDDRKQNTPSVQIRTDGTFDGVPLFQWHTPFFVMEPCDAISKWRKTNTITQYDVNSNEVENKNILSIYSSALYGYNGQLSTAVASNARQNEIGFESFEEYPAGSTSFNQFNNTAGNLDFLPEFCGPANFERYNRYSVFGGDNNSFEVKEPVSSFNIGDVFTLVAEAPQGVSSAEPYWRWIFRNCKIESLADQGDGTTLVGIDIDDLTMLRKSIFGRMSEGCWVGQMVVESKLNSVATEWDDVTISNARAHTGKISLRVGSDNYFPQSSLQLDENGKYVISAWISRDESKVASYTGDFVTVNCFTKTGTLLTSGTATFGTSGEVIEGWQKVEGTFTAPANTHHISIGLLAPSATTANSVYFDDIRLFPADGNMKTYVYDPQNYKLRALLNENNYASLYFYDEKGNLFLTKQETHKGVETVQEVRRFNKPN